MKSKFATIITLAAAINAATAAVSLNFSADFESGISQNLATSAGVPSNGLKWGVLVDGTGNGISRSNGTTGTKYDVLPGGLVAGQYVLSIGGVDTDDILIIATTTTVDTSLTGGVEGDGITGGGVGGIYDINVNLANGVTTGDAFYVVWFDGLRGGTLGDATFTIPSDTFAVNYGEPFVGVDPVRSAGLGYTGTSPTANPAGGIAFVPEPSAALLGAIGAIGLLRRRRA